MEYLIGVRYVDKFKTNPVTAKRDYLSLVNDTTDYYIVDNTTGTISRGDVGGDKVSISDADVAITKVD